MRILFGVFDWGLGHATRDIPLIEELLHRGHAVHILSTGRAMRLLRERFGKRCEYFDVPSIVNPYSRTRFFTLSFIFHIPLMVYSLRHSRNITKRIIRDGQYDKVISDCRYDVYDKVENSYFINHQLRFKSFSGSEQVGEWWLADRQRRYKHILVPDYEQHDLTGWLSHDLRFLEPQRIKYIGVLSQLRKRPVKKDIDYFISISGPEPQRTVLEKQILKSASALKGNVVITLGKPEQQGVRRKGNLTIHGFLDSAAQEMMMNRAKFVITRSGYTTVMELYELGVRRALFIPTPGQTEQEYLADLYEERGEFHHVHQQDLDLARDIAMTKRFSGFKQQWTTERSVREFMRLVLGGDQHQGIAKRARKQRSKSLVKQTH